jgi:hypothetical protein
MSKTITFILGAIIGLILGGGLIYYLFVGTPQALEKPGELIQKPAAENASPGTAQIVLKEEFFNTVLQTIFVEMESPSFPLNLSTNQPSSEDASTKFGLQSECEGKIKVIQKGSDVQTSVRFENEKINVPLAFQGKAKLFGNCIEFNGWSQANLELRYDQEKQFVYGIVNIETVNLDGISPILTNVVTPLIQNALNQNVNPIQIIDGKQISVNLPISATKGTLQANIKDVRAEVKDKALNLYVIYDFQGEKN